MTEFGLLQSIPSLSLKSLNSKKMTDNLVVPPPPSYPGHGAAGPGLLKTKISLGGKNPTVVLPFTLMKPELPPPSSINGSMNLLSNFGLDHAWNKFCASNRKLKDELSAFLPHLPGNIDLSGNQDNSSLRSLIDKPPICGKEILPLTTSALAGFKLQPGAVPENYRAFAAVDTAAATANPTSPAAGDRQSRKKRKRKHERSPVASSMSVDGVEKSELVRTGLGLSKFSDTASSAGSSGALAASGTSTLAEEAKKAKREESGNSEKKKKKKKDKKRKRSKSPESWSGANAAGSSSQLFGTMSTGPSLTSSNSYSFPAASTTSMTYTASDFVDF